MAGPIPRVVGWVDLGLELWLGIIWVVFGEVVGEIGGADADLTPEGVSVADVVCSPHYLFFNSAGPDQTVLSGRGGGPGGGSYDACWLSTQLRCGRLAAMATWAVLWPSCRCSVMVCYGQCTWAHHGRRRSMHAGVKTLSGFGQTDGCHHLPEVSIVVAPSPSVPDFHPTTRKSHLSMSINRVLCHLYV